MPVAAYLKANDKDSINGLPILFTIQEAGITTVDQFASEVVMRLGEDARGVVLNVVPALLRCSIRTFINGATVLFLPTNGRQPTSLQCRRTGRTKASNIRRWAATDWI